VSRLSCYCNSEVVLTSSCKIIISLRSSFKMEVSAEVNLLGRFYQLRLREFVFLSELLQNIQAQNGGHNIQMEVRFVNLVRVLLGS